ncbi:hypothetical protein BAE44_0017588 [Dichanthelium oligosanthes]|uniref:Secreted protein n=1 Tax=Dichanthelium oligosanthes TaxID=888268 RepID=A0A1E5V8A7_9POAL|nr:hypothetical protein BAE44_0017588 [Dichanthelium oligosanthes]
MPRRSGGVLSLGWNVLVFFQLRQLRCTTGGLTSENCSPRSDVVDYTHSSCSSFEEFGESATRVCSTGDPLCPMSFCNVSGRMLSFRS